MVSASERLRLLLSRRKISRALPLIIFNCLENVINRQTDDSGVSLNRELSVSQWRDTVVHKAGEDEPRERECTQQGQGQV